MTEEEATEKYMELLHAEQAAYEAYVKAHEASDNFLRGVLWWQDNGAK